MATSSGRTQLGVVAVFSVLMVGCGGGGSGGGGGGDFHGNFAIQGTPHGGLYTQCETTLSGGMATINCSGLQSGCSMDPQTGCSLGVMMGTAPGTYHCSDGSAEVAVFDPGLPASAVGEHPAMADCEKHVNEVTGTPYPDCPTDSAGCTTLVGDCTVIVTSTGPMDLNNPWGHFSGNVSGTLWSSEKVVGCNQQGDGQSVTIMASGAW